MVWEKGVSNRVGEVWGFLSNETNGDVSRVRVLFRGVLLLGWYLGVRFEFFV